MRVLLTGGAGFVGSHLAELLIADRHQVRVLDSLEGQVHGQSEWPAYLPEGVERVHGDVRDRLVVEAALDGIEVVSHQASVVGVGQSMYEVRRYVDANALGTATLLDVLANERHSVRKVVVAASMSAYGEGVYRCQQCGVVRPPVREDEQMRQQDWELHCPTCDRLVEPIGVPESAAQNCTSVYAITKKVQEELVLNVCGAYGIPAVALRYFNIYGPRQSLSNPYTGVAAIFLGRLKNGRSPLIFEDGQQTRDFVSVHDIARANLMAMLSDRADGQSLNVGTGRPTSVAAVASVLADTLGVRVEPEIVGRFRKGDIRHCFADVSKIERLLGWRPEVDLAAGMAELVAWSESEAPSDRVAQATDELTRRGLLV
ncbi:MAG TPA: NAD-dependent epimerase/dehydratase family protein [Chloroflexota bacterium]|jgi:dTDP-L-rhamnose 4-epimerase